MPNSFLLRQYQPSRSKIYAHIYFIFSKDKKPTGIHVLEVLRIWHLEVSTHLDREKRARKLSLRSFCENPHKHFVKVITHTRQTDNNDVAVIECITGKVALDEVNVN